AMGRERHDPLDRRFGHGRDVRSQSLNVRYRSLPVIEQSRARWARPLLNRKLCHRPAARTAPPLPPVPWEQVMVKDQSIGTGPETLGQPPLGWRPACINVVELVVLGNGPTWRECSDLRGDCLHFAPECYLALQQLVASGAITRTFIWKGY